MRPKSLYMETFGCQMNVLDSQLVRGLLERSGYAISEDMAAADVVLFNTCSVRQHAEDKVYSRLGILRQLKLTRPEMVIGVIGCMAERDGPGILSRMPHVDLLCGPGHLNHVHALIDQVMSDRTKDAAIALAGFERRNVAKSLRDPNANGLEDLDSSRQLFAEESPFQAYVRIQRGCDKFCTYCVVPYTRGPERSRKPSSIVEECKSLADRGVREITLLGQTVNSYQHEENGHLVRFADLLAMVHDVSGVARIRFTTSFPRDFPDTVFQAMRDLPKLCEYVHMPAQSGSDAVLRRMRRTYDVAEYRDVIARAKAHLPHGMLAGDFIVGFCGETDAEFEQSVELLKWARYKNSFIFKYSDRPGTAAHNKLPDDVPESVKKQRNHIMLAEQERISREIHEQQVGSLHEVLVEGPSKKASATGGTGRAGDGTEADGTLQLTGRTRGDLICVFDGVPGMIGELLHVRIDGASPYTLFGSVAAREGTPVPKPPPAAARIKLPILI